MYLEFQYRRAFLLKMQGETPFYQLTKCETSVYYHNPGGTNFEGEILSHGELNLWIIILEGLK